MISLQSLCAQDFYEFLTLVLSQSRDNELSRFPPFAPYSPPDPIPQKNKIHNKENMII